MTPNILLFTGQAYYVKLTAKTIRWIQRKHESILESQKCVRFNLKKKTYFEALLIKVSQHAMESLTRLLQTKTANAHHPNQVRRASTHIERWGGCTRRRITLGREFRCPFGSVARWVNVGDSQVTLYLATHFPPSVQFGSTNVCETIIINATLSS